MKKLLGIAFCMMFYIASAQEATIKIDRLRQIGEIDRNIYGVFMEPIRNSMDGLLYDPEHPLANADGFRSDYIEAALELKLPQMRWPGGNYTATYNWMDGIGPKENRPVRRELAWNVLDRNHIGTDEWLTLAKAMGVESSICINGGTGTIDDARYWIEYVNSPLGSYYSDLRAKNGHPEPYNVKYWHLGNEVDGAPWQAVSQTVEEYVRFAQESAKAMYFVNRGCKTCSQPTFLVMGSSWIIHEGVPADWPKWNWEVINGTINIPNVEYIAIHRYWGSDLTPDISGDRTPKVLLGDWAQHFNDYITTTRNQIQIAKEKHNLRDKPFYIAFTEWSGGAAGHMGTLVGALHFNLFVRHSDAVKRANYTMFTGLLSRNKEGQTYKTPFFYMYKLFSNNVNGKSLDVYVDCEKFDGKLYKNIPFLDVSAAYTEKTKSLIINVVNRNMEKSINTRITSDTGSFKGNASISLINTDDVNANYSYENRDKYSPVTSSLKVKGNVIDYTFPAHSFTQIIVEIE